MQSRPLGNSGIEASIVGLGTWAIGGWSWGGTDEQDSISAIHAALDSGINLIDTAPIYGMGLSEEIVGKALRGRRDSAILATKCGLRWDSTYGEFVFNDGTHDIYRNLSPEGIQLEVENSLQRLKTDVIDLYQTHWQEQVTPLEDVMATLLSLVDSGKIRSIGVSNVTPEILENYQKLGPIASIQEKFSMVDRVHVKDGLFPAAESSKTAILAYSPLDMGLLTGKIGPERTFGDGDMRKDNPRFSVESRTKVADLLATFEAFTQELECTMAQLVIAWTAQVSGISHVLCGARNANQATENAQAGSLTLSDDMLNAMSETVESMDIELPQPW
ncbi:MAG: aldo/keto reductase [Opitutales bacterium]